MKATDIPNFKGKRVIVFHKGLQLVGKLVGKPTNAFAWRDLLVLLPGEDRPRQFRADKVQKP